MSCHLSHLAPSLEDSSSAANYRGFRLANCREWPPPDFSVLVFAAAAFFATFFANFFDLAAVGLAAAFLPADGFFTFFALGAPAEAAAVVFEAAAAFFFGVPFAFGASATSSTISGAGAGGLAIFGFTTKGFGPDFPDFPSAVLLGPEPGGGIGVFPTGRAAA
jgi:hypothetical protein